MKLKIAFFRQKWIDLRQSKIQWSSNNSTDIVEYISSAKMLRFSDNLQSVIIWSRYAGSCWCWWIRRWRRRFPDCENAAGQSSQWYGRAPVWTRSCFVRVELSAKARPHCRQTYGRWPECVRMWVTRDELWVNRRPQALTGHAKGRSPVPHIVETCRHFR